MDNTLYCIKPGYVLREIAGECLAIPVGANTPTQEMIVLNPVSALLWRELESEKTLSELTAAVVKEFDAAEEEVSADILDFINELKSLDILI